MDRLGVVGLAIFCVSSLVVGLRLLALWRRTREKPELLAAITLLGIGPLGFTLTVASGLIGESATTIANTIWAIAALCLFVGTTAGFAFSKLVFYPESQAVQRIVVGVAVILTCCWFHELLTRGFTAHLPGGPAIRLSDWFRTAALLWGAFESLRYHARLRRRLALGLADPRVARRFLLWGLAMAGGGASSAIDAAVKLFVDRALDYPALTLLNAMAGTLSGICLWLAFLPRAQEVADAPSGAPDPPLR